MNTRSKREAVVKAAEIITGNERPMMTVNHAGVEIIVNGETMEQELAVVQAITTTKISREPRAPRMNVTEKWTSSLTQ